MGATRYVGDVAVDVVNNVVSSDAGTRTATVSTTEVEATHDVSIATFTSCDDPPSCTRVFGIEATIEHPSRSTGNSLAVVNPSGLAGNLLEHPSGSAGFATDAVNPSGCTVEIL